MKSYLFSILKYVYCCLIVLFTALSPCIVSAEAYCISSDLCFAMPEDFLVIDKAFSDNIARIMKERFPGMNIGFYAGLYETFYQNDLMPADRVYVQLNNTGNIFVIFSKMTPQQKMSFGEDAFIKGPWPYEPFEKAELESIMVEGLKLSKGLSQGGMSIDLLHMNQEKKYFLVKRTIDLTKERINQTENAGIPVGQPSKVVTDFIATKFGRNEGVILMFFADTTKNAEKFLPVYENSLSNIID